MRRHIFISIPRCGSTSISHSLYKTPLRTPTYPYVHWSYRKVKEAENTPFFSFAVIRNPLDRLISIYDYHHLHGSLRGVSFENWAGRKFSLPFIKDKEFIEVRGLTTDFSQLEYVCGGAGGSGVDCLLPFQKLDYWFPFLCDFLGIDAKLEHLNSGSIPSEERISMISPYASSLRSMLHADFALWDGVSSVSHSVRLHSLLENSSGLSQAVS